MKELFSVLRLAVYVLALPLTITAAASAHQWINASTRGQAAASETAHVIRLTDSGMLRGVVNTYGSSGKASVGNAVVSLMKGSQVVSRVNSGIDGAFSFSNVEPGKYTFVSASKDAISSFGIQVVAADSATGDSALRAFAAPRNSIVDGFASAAGKNVAAAVEASEVLRATESVDLVDGIFQGKVSAFNGKVGGNTITLVSGTEVVAEGSTDAQGAFAFSGVEPGFYTVIARGEGGFATMAVQVNDPTAVAPAETVYTSLIVRQEGFSATMSDSPVEYEIVEEIVSVEVVEETPAAIPGYGYGGGGFGGGPFGGGGGMGGFGLGGVGELIGLGIGAWVLTEVIDKIDDNDGQQWTPVPNPPPPVSGYNWVYL
ncbi:MAG: carboxypeptidase regulatory-like domain-containing protein [Planctomycetaceae bacterium]|nr:carboxypeptidase regulatory-like domain-containing protein [Planctomycetaceae bacterium]